jgi:arabinan endo-1,5-alpha-L-arabinosidase
MTRKSPPIATTAAAVVASLLAATAALAQPGPPPAAPVDPQARAVLAQLGNRSIGLHDPSTIVKCKDEYWLFSTGMNTPSWRSKDLVTWTRGPQVHSGPLAWAREAVPLNRGSDFWAPDVIQVGDRYLLFYSVSSFGKNTSAIGVTTNATLDPGDPAFRWTDGGMVVQSRENDDFNAIDPALILDTDGRLWMSFGSFWGGIKLIELDPKTGLRIAPDSPIYSLAHWDAIEAPYIYKRGDHYYLFVSLGMCCRGVNSTYHTRVGRSRAITGPYLDKEGKDLLLGGGTMFADAEGPYLGPGHAGIVEDADGKAWFSCHFYDRTARGASKLSVRPLTWGEDGWPVLGRHKG